MVLLYADMYNKDIPIGGILRRMTRQVVTDAKIRMTSVFGGSENQITSQHFTAVGFNRCIWKQRHRLASCDHCRRRGDNQHHSQLWQRQAHGNPEDWVVNVQTRAVFGGVARSVLPPHRFRGTTYSNGAVSLWQRGGKVLRLGRSWVGEWDGRFANRPYEMFVSYI